MSQASTTLTRRRSNKAHSRWAAVAAAAFADGKKIGDVTANGLGDGYDIAKIQLSRFVQTTPRFCPPRLFPTRRRSHLEGRFPHGPH